MERFLPMRDIINDDAEASHVSSVSHHQNAISSSHSSSPSTLFDINQNVAKSPKLSLTDRMRDRRLFLREHGIRVFGTSSHHSPKTTPVWFDRKAFKRAQSVFRIYGAM